jgi:hypothetical protein
VFDHFIWSGYFSKCEGFSTLKGFHFQAFLSNANSILTGKRCARTSSCKPWHLLTRDRMCLPFTWKGLFAQRWQSSYFKTLRDRQYSFWELTQFKLLNKVLDPLSCNVCALLQDIQQCFPSLKGVITHQNDVPHTSKPWETGGMPLNLYSTPTAEQGARPSCFKHYWFCYTSSTATSIHLYRAIFKKGDVPNSWKHWEVGIIPLNSTLNSWC